MKTNLSSLIESKYKVVTLGNHIIEQKDKVKPFDFPEDDFKILGVSNKVGLFDNEIKKGRDKSSLQNSKRWILDGNSRQNRDNQVNAAKILKFPPYGTMD